MKTTITFTDDRFPEMVMELYGRETFNVKIGDVTIDMRMAGIPPSEKFGLEEAKAFAEEYFDDIAKGRTII